MKHFTRPWSIMLLALVLLAILATLLVSCDYEDAYAIGEKAEEVRLAAQELWEGFQAGSGWCAGSVVMPFLLLGGLAVLLRRADES